MEDKIKNNSATWRRKVEMRKLTQKYLALELLKDNPMQWIPAWQFVGENKINGEWYLFTYSVPKRLSDLYNDGLVERQLVKGRSGAKYYSYKFKGI